MKCKRCSGLVVLTRIYDRFVVLYYWRCINCGALTSSREVAA